MKVCCDTPEIEIIVSLSCLQETAELRECQNCGRVSTHVFGRPPDPGKSYGWTSSKADYMERLRHEVVELAIKYCGFESGGSAYTDRGDFTLPVRRRP